MIKIITLNEDDILFDEKAAGEALIGVFDLSKVCQGMGLPMLTRKVLCTFLYISSTRNSMARLNGR